MQVAPLEQKLSWVSLRVRVDKLMAICAEPDAVRDFATRCISHLDTVSSRSDASSVYVSSLTDAHGLFRGCRRPGGQHTAFEIRAHHSCPTRQGLDHNLREVRSH